MEKETLEFRIDAYTPKTLPLARLADYLTQLAALYGSREAVHFEKLRSGSAIMEAWVELTESANVIRRVREAATSRAPDDARRAYLKLDQMLRDNNAIGEIKRKGGAKILSFPGRKLPEPKPIVVVEYGEVDGMIIRVGGRDETIPVHLLAASGDVYPCEVRDRGMARDLAQLIYAEPVRVRGKGEWERSPEGSWKLIGLTIEGWDVLDQTPADEVFQRLRAISGNGWKTVEDPERELRRIRHGE